MLLDVCLGTKAAWRVLSLYGESPGAGFTRQDIKKHTKLGNKALSISLKRLVAFGILRKSKEQFSLAVYKLNTDSNYTRDIINILKKEQNDLNHLPYDFGMIAREFARLVLDKFDACGIYLFGSIAKGTYRDDSDMDFAVIVKKKTPKEDIELNTVCSRLTENYKRRIQCFLFSQGEFAKSDLSDEILKHGIRLA